MNCRRFKVGSLIMNAVMHCVQTVERRNCDWKVACSNHRSGTIHIFSTSCTDSVFFGIDIKPRPLVKSYWWRVIILFTFLIQVSTNSCTNKIGHLHDEETRHHVSLPESHYEYTIDKQVLVTLQASETTKLHMQMTLELNYQGVCWVFRFNLLKWNLYIP